MREVLDPCDICPRRRRCTAVCEMSNPDEGEDEADAKLDAAEASEEARMDRDD